MLYKEKETSGEQTPPHNDLELAEIRRNLGQIKKIVAIAGAKGGCGKSALTVNLAAALAIRGRKVGIIDADLNSPSIATMLGMGRVQIYPVSGGVEPANGPLGLRVMSSDLLQDAAEPPLAFEEVEVLAETNGNAKVEISETQALRDFASQTRFGALDLLFIDVANGTDHLLRLMDAVSPSGVLIITQPSELAIQSTRRLLESAVKLNLPLIGIVENMSGFFCGGCHSVRPLLPQGDTAGLARSFDLPMLERLPFDERMAETGDRGVPFVKAHADLPLSRKLGELAQKLEDAIKAKPAPVPARVPSFADHSSS